ncbi:effector-associated constant component EACC1 [Nocardia flavorosea]|uniref:Uncharacterized protein n=1 Tax=Nocardia flavorosea TaxID=53429 RepID=A0A846YJE3_9NOCA|nr:hypothetical protein [Nocardia flavorosea]NKY57238.1 hypothetical protein [Nocardia flavorosea]
MSFAENPVDVAISVSSTSDPGAEIRSLFRWLQREDDLPMPKPASATPGPEDMGTVSETLVIALNSGSAVVLATSLSVWVRHRTSDVKVTFRGKKGTVQVDAKRLQDPHAVVEALREATEKL